MAAVHEEEVRKAEALADIFIQLKKDLLEAGASITGIEKFIAERTAASDGMMSDKPLDESNPTWRVGQAFEQRVKQQL